MEKQPNPPDFIYLDKITNKELIIKTMKKLEKLECFWILIAFHFNVKTRLHLKYLTAPKLGRSKHDEILLKMIFLNFSQVLFSLNFLTQSSSLKV